MKNWRKMVSVGRVVVLVLLMVVSALVFTGCGKSKIVGTWEEIDSGSEVVFFEDGTIYFTGSAGEWDVSGSKLLLTIPSDSYFDGNNDYKMKVNVKISGNKMKWTNCEVNGKKMDGENESFEFEKVKD